MDAFVENIGSELVLDSFFPPLVEEEFPILAYRTCRDRLARSSSPSRLSRRLCASNKSILRWPGGKRGLLSELNESFGECERFVEPFVGSGVVFMNVDAGRYLVADKNRDLINLYERVASSPDDLISDLEKLFVPENNEREAFDRLRGEFNGIAEFDARRAALFVYLNRHCFNGVCRYNLAGRFNVSFGGVRSPAVPAEEIHVMSARLQATDLRHADFREVMAEAGRGDVIYCDPPYVPEVGRKSSRPDKIPNVNYVQDNFSMEDQAELAELARAAAARGARVVVSNHDTPDTRRLYAGAEICGVMARRSINCQGDGRGWAREVIAVFRP